MFNQTFSIKNPHFLHDNIYTNKRAQRALGRSPEENVKGHGEAI